MRLPTLAIELSDLDVALLFASYNMPAPPIVEGELKSLDEAMLVRATQDLFEHLGAQGLVLKSEETPRFESEFGELLSICFHPESMVTIEDSQRILGTVYRGPTQTVSVSRSASGGVQMSGGSQLETATVVAGLLGVSAESDRGGVVSIVGGAQDADQLLVAFREGKSPAVTKICKKNGWDSTVAEMLLARMDFASRPDECQRLIGFRVGVDGTTMSRSYYSDGHFWLMKWIIVGKTTKNAAFARVTVEGLLDYCMDFTK